MKPWRFIALLIAFVHGAAMAQGTTACKWPITLALDTPKTTLYAMHPIGQLPGGPPPPPAQMMPAYNIAVSLKESASDTDLLDIHVASEFDISDIARNFPGLVQKSDAWRAFQAELTCKKRAKDYEFNLSESNGSLLAKVGFVVEKHECGGLTDGCQICVRAAGARVSSTSVIRAALQGDTLTATVVDVSTDVHTSPEQDFILGLIGGVGFFGPIGINLVSDLKSQALNGIKSTLQDSLRGLSLPVTPLPNNANLKVPLRHDSVRFASNAAWPMTVQVDSRVNENAAERRKGTACAWARSVPKRSISEGTGTARQIRVAATAYLRGEGVALSSGLALAYGQGVLLNAPPYQARANAAEFEIDVDLPGKYVFYVEYAAAEPRPTKVQLNGADVGLTVLNTALAEATGCWEARCMKRVWVDQVQLKQGKNVIRLSRDGVFPHIHGLYFRLTN